MLRALAAGAVGYAAGLLPSAELVAGDRDIRNEGSGNPGAANVTNVVGKRAGAIVFALDMGKALAAGRAGAALAGTNGVNIAASAAVLGHCFPATRNFRGGKGVAASFGQMLATFPAYLPIDIALAAVAAKSDFWKRRPVAVVGVTCALWTALAALWHHRRLPNLWAGQAPASMPISAAVSSAAIVYRFVVEATPPAPDLESDSVGTTDLE